MNDISEDAGDTELALAMEEQVNARVMAVLEHLLGCGMGELTAHAANPREAQGTFANRISRALQRSEHERMLYEQHNMAEYERMLAQQNMLRAKEQQAAMQNAVSSAIGQQRKGLYDWQDQDQSWIGKILKG